MTKDSTRESFTILYYCLCWTAPAADLPFVYTWLKLQKCVWRELNSLPSFFLSSGCLVRLHVCFIRLGKNEIHSRWYQFNHLLHKISHTLYLLVLVNEENNFTDFINEQQGGRKPEHCKTRDYKALTCIERGEERVGGSNGEREAGGGGRRDGGGEIWEEG